MIRSITEENGVWTISLSRRTTDVTIDTTTLTGSPSARRRTGQWYLPLLGVGQDG